eukprot:Phypoly_transcript_03994.p1 GENE.Phypoly_transcript_03994~~Phypoly_transcript_03994.p1  ORF type:complete len:754 (+),score=76.93 Phypoly_transcript_03994:29-2263(+)
MDSIPYRAPKNKSYYAKWKQILPLVVSIISAVSMFAFLFHADVQYMVMLMRAVGDSILCICFLGVAVIYRAHWKSSVMLALCFAMGAIEWNFYTVANNLFYMPASLIFHLLKVFNWSWKLLRLFLKVCCVIQLSAEIFVKISIKPLASKVWISLLLMEGVVTYIFYTVYKIYTPRMSYVSEEWLDIALLVPVVTLIGQTIVVILSLIAEIHTQSRNHWFALNSHGSTGFVLLLIYGSLAAELGTAIVPPSDYPFFNFKIVLLYSTSSVTSISYLFYLWDIIRSNKNLEQKIHISFYTWMVGIYFVTIGTVKQMTAYGTDFLLIIASCSAWFALVSLCVLILSVTSPILQLFCTYIKYDILYHHMRELPIYKVATYNFAFFSIVHVIAHLCKWAIDPALRVRVDEEIEVPLYSPNYPFFVTSVGMIVFLYSLEVTWRLYASGIGLALFFFHGSQQLLSPFYSRRVLIGVLLICAITHFVLVLLNRSMTVAILPEQSVIQTFHSPQENGNLLFLVVDPPSSPTTLPGSHFTIYSTRKFLKRFDGITLPLFSSHHQRLAFFFYCISPAPRNACELLHKVDSAKKNFGDKEVKLSLLGPFHGPTSLLLQYIHNLSPSVIFLCATGVGFVNVVSIVAYLKAKQLRHRLLKVYVFYHLTEAELASLGELFNKISGFYPFGDIRESSQNNLMYFAKPQNDPSHIIDFAYSKLDQVDIIAGGNKAIYYCGREVCNQFGAFGHDWQKFNEILM